ncbi:MAG: hypothetical protein HYY46_21215 [Deltaproteobacteria bacterium]|nr:hypothetical protein [Deltaproteobacteria bacterium]
MKEVRYKGCLIRANALRLRNGLWEAQVLIYRGQGSPINETPVYDQKGGVFPNAAEAEIHALALAGAWIDAQEE